LSVYAVEKVCRRLIIDLSFRDAIAADPERVLMLASPPLEDGERRALLAGDVGVLARAGANPFLLCQLGRLGMFGLNHQRYAERIRAEFAAERAAMAAASTAAAPAFGTTGSFGR
jgi:hypothetical protein